MVSIGQQGVRYQIVRKSKNELCGNQRETKGAPSKEMQVLQLYEHTFPDIAAIHIKEPASRRMPAPV
jgi:hypothetical protein